MPKTLQDWLSWQETLHPEEIELGLQRVSDVLYRLLPDCQQATNNTCKLPYTIVTIAGTNGKGSTVAMLESILNEAGYHVGSYTSPHLLHYNERIKINLQSVSDQALCDSFERIDRARDDTSLTYFEFGTLAAIDIFYQQKCEIVILEVGLGGRLDAVNIVDPDITLVTTVDIDHQDWLGSDRETIAIEKAGIYRPDKPAIYGDSDCPQSIYDIVAQQQLDFYQYSVDYQEQLREQQWDWLPDNESKNFSARYNLSLPSLQGEVQLKNAANVIMIVELLKQTWPVSQAEIKRGLLNVQLPGRFQVVSTEPLVILDVAHNVQATRALVKSLTKATDTLKAPQRTGKLQVIIGMLQDKDVSEVLTIMAPFVSQWRFIDLHSPRAMSAHDMAALLKSDVLTMTDETEMLPSSGKNIHCFANFQLAYDDFQKKQLMFNSNETLLVFGSFFTVTDALNYFQSSESDE